MATLLHIYLKGLKHDWSNEVMLMKKIKELFRYWIAVYRLGKAMKKFLYVDEVLNADYVVSKRSRIIMTPDMGCFLFELVFELLDEHSFNKKYKINLEDYLQKG